MDLLHDYKLLSTSQLCRGSMKASAHLLTNYNIFSWLHGCTCESILDLKWCLLCFVAEFSGGPSKVSAVRSYLPDALPTIGNSSGCFPFLRRASQSAQYMSQIIYVWWNDYAKLTKCESIDNNIYNQANKYKLNS
jgi:hypothetical protein